MGKSTEIVLIDEDGVEHHFELYRIIELDGVAYALLQEPDVEDELIILRIEGSIESGNLVTLDDEEWERVTEQIDGLGLLDDDEFDDLDDED